MICPNCQVELSDTVKFCTECGYEIGSEHFPADKRPEKGAASKLLRPLSGFRRNLSTELAARQAEMRTLVKFRDLLKEKTYEPGEIIIEKGDKGRDLFFLTDGILEISTEEPTGNILLNEVEAPDIVGDIAFLSGFPRTATAQAKTPVRLFVLRYEDFKDLFHEFPDWVQPLLTSFVSGIKTLHIKIRRLERNLSELKSG